MLDHLFHDGRISSDNAHDPERILSTLFPENLPEVKASNSMIFRLGHRIDELFHFSSILAAEKALRNAAKSG